MEKKRSSVGISIGIAFIFFGLLGLFNSIIVAAAYKSSQLYWNIISVIYILVGFILLGKWDILKYWQKGAFIGMLVRLIIIGLIGSYFFLPISRSMSNLEYYSFKLFDVISSPFHELYNKLIAYPRAVETAGVIAISMKHWEMFICTILDILYACIVGGVIGVLIEKKKSSPTPPSA